MSSSPCAEADLRASAARGALAPPDGAGARLGALVARHRWAVLWTTALLLAVAAAVGAGLPARLSHGGFTNPGAESGRALEAVEHHYNAGGTSTVVIFRSETLTVHDLEFGEAVRTALGDVPRTVMAGAQHYWNTGKRELLSADGHAACVVVGLAGTGDQAKDASYERLRRLLHVDGFTVAYAGEVPLQVDLDRTVDDDLTRAELYVFPLLFLLLLLFFGSLTAALLPLAVAGTSLAMSFAVLRLLSPLVPVSYITRNVVVMIALGLSVDYALFVVVRFRRELRHRGDPHRAVAATMATAGHTVLYSATAISLAVLGLTLLPFPITRSLGIGAAVTVALAGAASLTMLPAVLAVLGPRVEAGCVRLPGFGRAGLGRAWAEGEETGFWYRLGRSAVTHPWAWLTAAVAVIAVLSVPVVGLHLAASDLRTLPAGAASRRAQELLHEDFPAAGLDQLQVVAHLRDDIGGEPGRTALARWQQRLAGLPNAQDVRLRATTAHSALMSVTAPAAPDAPVAEELMRAVRALDPPDGGRVLVGGPAAVNVDVLDTLKARLPALVGYLLVVTFGLLFLAFRSLLVPLKAVVTTTMSLGIAFAAVTWTVQDGHGARLLGLQPAGYVGALESAIMLMFVFALSVDYELFLIAQIRELHRGGMDNASAVVTGLGRTGGLISAAAALIVLVAAAFATSPVLTVKEIAIGVVVAVAVDATVVRMLLVPATMRLLGELNWWTPRLRRRTAPSGPRPEPLRDLGAVE
ncbi:MMPL family transporter [Kitasatospora sp. NPDC058046]|uniref:MMPL family transporter n=1 Tax=Kitasatospora sp. NPDC058046 TaxID=3346312 RepID=UPI0036D9E764